jgi:hypothetical protein
MDDRTESMLWNYKAPSSEPRRPNPCEFVRASDNRPIACELMFHGESYKREATSRPRRDLVLARRVSVEGAGDHVGVEGEEDMEGRPRIRLGF